jgi:hypothetical protein
MDDTNEPERLTGGELLAMAGLLRLLIRMDGQFTAGEREALVRVGDMISQAVEVDELGSPYRTSGERIAPLGERALYDMLDLAGEELPNDDAVREAALAVTRPEARAAIYGVVFEVASSDTAMVREPQLLDWLVAAWNLPVEPVQ